MQKKILPYDLNVESIASQTHAFSLGVIKANLQNYDCWLTNKYVNFVCNTDYPAFIIYDEDVWACKDGLLSHQRITFDPDKIEQECAKIVEENKRRLNNEFYIFGVYNEFYIPQKSSYMKQDFRHGYIIFGYDDKEQVFKSAGYLESGHYEYFDIKYENYYNSLVGIDNRKLWIEYYNVNHDYCPHVDVAKLKIKLDKFLNAQPDEYNDEPDAIFGVDATQFFYQYTKGNDNNKLDLRYGRGYMEHKCIMYKRLMYLYDHKYIKDSTLCEENMKNVYSKSKIVFNLFLKFYITKDIQLLKKIPSIVLDINNSEKVFFERLLQELALS